MDTHLRVFSEQPRFMTMGTVKDNQVVNIPIEKRSETADLKHSSVHECSPFMGAHLYFHNGNSKKILFTLVKFIFRHRLNEAHQQLVRLA